MDIEERLYKLKNGIPNIIWAANEIESLMAKSLDLLTENLLLHEKISVLEEAAKKVTGWDIPTAYRDENDDTGHCPYCKGWNMEHKADCKIYALGKLIGNTPEFTPPQEDE